jgi:hypothetical protein
MAQHMAQGAPDAAVLVHEPDGRAAQEGHRRTGDGDQQQKTGEFAHGRQG